MVTKKEYHSWKFILCPLERLPFSWPSSARTWQTRTISGSLMTLSSGTLPLPKLDVLYVNETSAGDVVFEPRELHLTAHTSTKFTPRPHSAPETFHNLDDTHPSAAGTRSATAKAQGQDATVVHNTNNISNIRHVRQRVATQSGRRNHRAQTLAGISFHRASNLQILSLEVKQEPDLLRTTRRLSALDQLRREAFTMFVV